MLQDVNSFEPQLRVVDGQPRDRGEPLGSKRLASAKRAFTTRRVELGSGMRLLRTGQPRAGDLVLAQIESLGQHQRVESPHGRRAQLYEGDEIIVVYGERYAPDQFEAVLPEDLGPCDLFAGGGVAGKVVSRHAILPGMLYRYARCAKSGRK